MNDKQCEAICAEIGFFGFVLFLAILIHGCMTSPIDYREKKSEPISIEEIDDFCKDLIKKED
jgi:hypothetical protein